MRTITTNVYSFDELNENAKKKALDLMRQQAFESASQTDWEDANDTIKQVEEIAHVRCDIQSSSQGYYARWYTNTDEQYELTDEEEFERFLKNFDSDFRGDTWSDDMMCDILSNAEFDDKRSYAGNIAWLIVAFCSKVEQSTLGYFEDGYVEEFIEANEMEFYADGRVFQSYK